MAASKTRRLGQTSPSKALVRRVALIVAACVAAVVVAVLVIRQASAQPVSVYPVANVMSYGDDSSTVQGVVSEGRVQNVALRDATVTSVGVTEGQEVHKGDVLLTYDTTSFRIQLMKDEADIATQEAAIAQAEKSAATYASLEPSENAPQPTYRTIDHGDLALVSRVDGVPQDGAKYRCSEDTVVSAAFLKALRSSGASVTLELYAVDGGTKTLVGMVELDGSELAEDYAPLEEYSYTEYAPADDPQPADPADPGDGGGADDDGSGDPSASTPTLYTRTTETVDPLDDDWDLRDAFSLSSEGLSVLPGERILGTVVAREPEAYQRYETEEVDPPESQGDNYVYSRAELASMVAEQRKAAQDARLALRQAQLAYQRDQLTAQTGEVTAQIDGTVMTVRDVSAAKAGDTVICVRGQESYAVTLYVGEDALADVHVGDTYDVSTWQSGQGFTASVTEVGTTPVGGDWSYGGANPNTSWYPVTCVATDVSEGDGSTLEVGEGCQATKEGSASASGSLYLDKMYVRRDKQGAYVMAKGADGRLERRPVTCGRTLWGSSVQILSGVTEDDSIAFPYGTDVVPGAATVDADYPDY